MSSACIILPHVPVEGFKPTFICNPLSNLDAELYGSSIRKDVEEIGNILNKRSKELVNLYYKKTYYRFLSLIFSKTRDISCDNIFDILLKSLSYLEFADACGSILIIAAREGYDYILEIILNYLKEEEDTRFSLIVPMAQPSNTQNRFRQYLNCKDENGRSVFINIILREKENNQTAYTKSLTFLKKNKGYFDIDAVDSFGNTALHYAAQHDFVLDGEDQIDHIFIMTLIENGACINMMNKEGICVVDRLPTKMLEAFLDNCIKDSIDKNSRNYALEIDFNLMTSKCEVGFLKALQNSNEKNHLLQHPVIATFLLIRCQQVKYTLLITPFFFFLFGLLVFFYMMYFNEFLMDYGFIDDRDDMDELCVIFKKHETTPKKCFEVFIAIFALFIIISEIFQVHTHRLKYFQSLRNYTNLLFITLTLKMLYTENYGVKQRLMAWLIPITPIAFLLIVERLHERIAIYVHMFKRISIKYLKFMIFFLFPVGAFGISFYFSMKKNSKKETLDEKIVTQAMFSLTTSPSNQPEPEPEPEWTETELKTKNETRFALTTWESVLKTLTMSTGEFDFSNLALQPSTGFIFFAFVFFVYLVSMNLLNGTAIMDIQEILDYKKKYHIQRQVFCLFRFNELKHIMICIGKHISSVFRILQVFDLEYYFPDKKIKLYHNKDATANQKRYVRCNNVDHRKGTIKKKENKCVSYLRSFPKNKKYELDLKCEERQNIQYKKYEQFDQPNCDFGHKFMIPSGYMVHAKQILDNQKRKADSTYNWETTYL